MANRNKHLADRPVSPHTYKNHGCRCAECTAEWAAYMGPKVTRWRKTQKGDLNGQ